MKPTLFIGTSVESLRLGYAIQQELEHDAEVTIWSQGIFQLSNSTLEDLCKSLELFDFALFVFSPSDTTIIRKEEFNSVRDNVLFEFGLFVGRLGRERTFFVIPRGDADLRIPTDLLGIKAGTYWPNRQDGNLRAALGPSCNEIRQVINRLGFRARANVRIYEYQNSQYFHDIQEFINSVQDIEVQLLEFSAKTIEDNFLSSLVFANSKIDLLVTHPDFAPNEYQKDRLRIAIQDLVSLKGRHAEPEKFQNQKSSAPRGGVWKSFARKPLVSIASLYFSPQGAGNYTHTRLNAISKPHPCVVASSTII